MRCHVIQQDNLCQHREKLIMKQNIDEQNMIEFRGIFSPSLGAGYPSETIIRVPTSITLDSILENFKDFLNGCGYCLELDDEIVIQKRS